MQPSIDLTDAGTLLAIQAGLSLIASGMVHFPRYNFPLFLFGVVAFELQSTSRPLRLFAGFLALSALLDMVWVFGGRWKSGVALLLVLLSLVLKLPTFYATISTLRTRGDDTYAAVPSVNFSRDGVSLGPSTSNEPIWQLPDGNDLERADHAPSSRAGGNGGGQGGSSAPPQQQEQQQPPPPVRQTNQRAGEGSYQSI